MRRKGVFRIACLIFVASTASGCIDDDDDPIVIIEDAGVSDAGRSCSTRSSCSKGVCTCLGEGPNQGKTCCDPLSATCASSPDNCNTFCSVCK
jgi:hypothetical protein